MREAIARAPVGDDQYGEDPSVLALQERVAELLGKEAALFVPTGTMANQLPLKLYCRPGDDVSSGVRAMRCGTRPARRQPTPACSSRRSAPRPLHGGRVPRGPQPARPPALSADHAGRGRGHAEPRGRARLGPGGLERVGAAAREHGVASYLDGARLLNAATARGDARPRLPRRSTSSRSRSPRASAARRAPWWPARARTSPPPSATAGCWAARCARPAILAAAGVYALEHHVERLADDHANARMIGEAVAAVPGVALDLGSAGDQHRRLPPRRRRARRGRPWWSAPARRTCW